MQSEPSDNAPQWGRLGQILSWSKFPPHSTHVLTRTLHLSRLVKPESGGVQPCMEGVCRVKGGAHRGHPVWPEPPIGPACHLEGWGHSHDSYLLEAGAQHVTINADGHGMAGGQ